MLLEHFLQEDIAGIQLEFIADDDLRMQVKQHALPFLVVVRFVKVDIFFELVFVDRHTRQHQLHFFGSNGRALQLLQR